MYKIVNIPADGARHRIGNFGLVDIKEDLPQEICEAGFELGMPYFQKIESDAIVSEEIVAEKKSLIEEQNK